MTENSSFVATVPVEYNQTGRTDYPERQASGFTDQVSRCAHRKSTDERTSPEATMDESGAHRHEDCGTALRYASDRHCDATEIYCRLLTNGPTKPAETARRSTIFLS